MTKIMKKFCWSTLNVRNLEESVQFYTKIIGLEVESEMNAGPDMKIVFLGKGETQIELICNSNNKEINIGNDISWGFEVESLDEQLELVKDNGIKVEAGPTQPTPKVKYFFIKDPNGLTIQLVENIK